MLIDRNITLRWQKSQQNNLNIPSFLLTSLCVFSVRFAVSSDKRLDSSTSLSAAALSDSAFA